ncbi:MAG: peptidylprolyl isomerase [Candidatus Krumholzibacteriaceae bacterium]
MVPVPDVSPPVARRVSVYVAVLVLAISLLVLAPPPAHSQADTTAKAAAASGAAAAEGTAGALPRMVITTEKYGDIVIELYPKEAPKAVDRVLGLVRAGFYNGLPFHRVESYVIQTGSAESTLPPIEGEMFGVKLTHEDGMVGMARLPDDYDSAKTQFYICKDHLPHMNGEYTLFGKVIQGLDIVHKIKKGDIIKTVKVVE